MKIMCIISCAIWMAIAVNAIVSVAFIATSDKSSGELLEIIKAGPFTDNMPVLEYTNGCMPIVTVTNLNVVKIIQKPRDEGRLALMSWDREFNAVLKAISFVESTDRDLGVHPDGVSYGRYGVTKKAVRELSKTIDISDGIDLTNPKANEYAAWEYLRLMHTRHKCTNWIEAAGFYHGGSESNRAVYIEKITKALETL